MVFSWLADTASAVIGAVLPAFYTLKSLRYASKRENRQQQAYWLKYWAVYALVSAVDSVADKLFLTYLIPGYSFLKLTFTIWSVLPVTRGAEIIYEKLLAPEFRRREVSIDALLANAVSRAQPLAFQTLTTAGGVLARGVAGVLTPNYMAMQELRYEQMREEAPRAYAANIEEMDDDDDDVNFGGDRLEPVFGRAIKQEIVEEEFEVVYENIVIPPRHETLPAESDTGDAEMECECMECARRLLPAPSAAVKRRGRGAKKTKPEIDVAGPSRGTRASSRRARQNKDL